MDTLGQISQEGWNVTTPILTNNQEERILNDSQVQQNNLVTIQKIIDLKKQNIDVNLFIGRVPVEPLPKNEKQIRWVSLSVIRIKIDLAPSKEDGLHLIMDINDSEQMKAITGLFLLVVVDRSTRKFIEEEGFLNIFAAIQLGGELVTEHDLHGGGLENIQEIGYLRACRKFNADFKKFVTDFFHEKFSVVLDFSKTKRHFIYDDQIHNNKKLIYELDEYKKWKESDNCFDELNEMLRFFEHLAEEKEIIDPRRVLSKKQLAAEKDRRTEQMSHHFNQIDFIKDKYPYENRYDYKGRAKTEYFHAIGKK